MLAPWISYDEYRAVVVLPRAQQRTCRHEWRRTIWPTKGGWPNICLKCGAKAR